MRWLRRLFESPPDESYMCPIHGKVGRAVRIKYMGELDGLYCGKCQAEFWAKTLKRVEKA